MEEVGRKLGVWCDGWEAEVEEFKVQKLNRLRWVDDDGGLDSRRLKRSQKPHPENQQGAVPSGALVPRASYSHCPITENFLTFMSENRNS
jgi:hypothetical protein